MTIGEAAAIDGAGGMDTLSTVRRASIIGIVVFGAVFASIAFRMDSSLASLWPANALLLGMLVRWPRLATV